MPNGEHMRLWLLISAIFIAGGALAYFQLTKPDEAQMHGVQATEGAEGAPIVEVVVPAQLSEVATLGKNGFDAKCATCHGENAAGKDGFGPPLVHKIYEPNHHSDQAIMMAPLMGVRAHHWNFGNMPPVEGVTEDDMRYIVAYIREMQAANGIQ